MAALIFFILFGYKTVAALTSSFPCEETSNCTCIRQLGSYMIECPAEFMLSAEYRRGHSFQIQCKNSNNIDFSLLKGLNIGPIKYFALKFCPLPKTTFKALMTSLQITGVTQVDFKSYSELGDGLLPRHFEDLESVTQISLNNNGLTSLPENIFDGMPKLTSLSLLDNRWKTIPRQVFSKTPRLVVLELGKNQLVNLEPGVLHNLTDLRLLNLWSNQLRNLTRQIFADVPNLENLDLTANGLETLPQDIFADLAKLSALNLNHNEFTQLPSGLFSGTPSLERLRLNFNKKPLRTLPNGFLSNLTMLSEVSVTQGNISTLPEDLFWDSPNVETVSFEGNQLTELPAKLFRDTKRLRSVDFRNNKLESLPDFMFSSALKLKVAKFSNNNLHKISSDTFRKLLQLRTLDLEHNALTTIDEDAFSSLQSLSEINLSSNNFTFKDRSHSLGGSHSPLRYCYKLEIVLLANNNIDRVFEDWKLLLPSLRILDLSQNKIKTITKEDLFFVSGEITLDLTNNEITKVDLQHIESAVLIMGPNRESGKARTHVMVRNNPIICDCFIYDLIRYFEGALIPEVRSLLSIDVGDTRCAGPAALQHSKVSNLTSKSLVCALEHVANVSTPCPSKCSCAFRVYDQAVVIDCSNGNFTQIPELPTVDGAQKTELNMSHNSLQKLPTDNTFTEHNITNIDVSYNHIADVEEVLFPKSLQALYLDHNNLTMLSEKMLTFLRGLENLTELSLHENSWRCDGESDSRLLMKFIHKLCKKIVDYENTIVC